MKKIITLLLTMAMVLSLPACGNSNSKNEGQSSSTPFGITPEPSLEEKLATATEIDWKALGEEVSANTARAKANYEGQYFLYTGTVDKIEEDYCILVENGKSGFVNVHLSMDELIQLNVGDKITVVGNLMDINYKVLRLASLVEVLPVSENVEQAIHDFATYESMWALKLILEKKDELPQATADDMTGLSNGRMIERTQYYRNTDGELSSYAFYRAILSIRTDGTGKTIEPGTEDIKWKFEDGTLYFISTSDNKPLTDDIQYQYDVRLLTIGEDTIYVCYGMNDTQVMLLFSASSSIS